MAVVIPRPVVVIDKIPTHDVVDVAVLVVIDPVIRNFPGIVPDIFGSDIAVVPIETRIDDGDDDRLRITLDQPPRRIRRGVEPDVLQRPLVPTLFPPPPLANQNSLTL